MKVHRVQMMATAMAVSFAMIGVVRAEMGATLTGEKQVVVSPDEAVELLKEGNQRFVRGESIEWAFRDQVKQTAHGQFPFAAIVTCIDSRVPSAIVFDRGIGDLFVARVAGNFVNDDILGSLEYATKLAGSKLIVIMGHTECGAVKGACDAAQLGLLTTTLANINPAVMAVQGDYSSRDSKSREFVQDVADMNVKLTMQKLRDRSLVLREMLDKGEIRMVGAMYDVSTGEVEFLK